MTLSFKVLGVPVPQGSKDGKIINGRVVMHERNEKRLKSWRTDVADAARAAHAGRPPYDGAIWLYATFVMPRPKSARKAARWCTVAPDVDKLTRALGDSLTIAGVIRDDARICDARVCKMLAAVDDPWTGAEVILGTMPNGERGGLVPIRTAGKTCDVQSELL